MAAASATQKNSEIELSKFAGQAILIETAAVDSSLGDQITVTFERPFSAEPKVLAVSAISPVIGAVGLFPAPFVKTISATAMVIGLGGLGTLTGTKINVLLKGSF